MYDEGEESQACHAETLTLIRSLLPLIASHTGDSTIPMTESQLTAFNRLSKRVAEWGFTE